MFEVIIKKVGMDMFGLGSMVVLSVDELRKEKVFSV